MASQRPETPQAAVGDKTEVLHVEAQEKDNDEKFQNVDEFGAHVKTDPKEVALVRKLDMYMLVSLACAIETLIPNILLQYADFL